MQYVVAQFEAAIGIVVFRWYMPVSDASNKAVDFTHDRVVDLKIDI